MKDNESRMGVILSCFLAGAGDVRVSSTSLLSFNQPLCFDSPPPRSNVAVCRPSNAIALLSPITLLLLEIEIYSLKQPHFVATKH